MSHRPYGSLEKRSWEIHGILVTMTQEKKCKNESANGDFNARNGKTRNPPPPQKKKEKINKNRGYDKIRNLCWVTQLAPHVYQIWWL